MMKRPEETTKNHETSRECFYVDEPPCSRFKEYVTEEEEAILAEIRTIQQEAKEIKNRLRAMDESGTAENPPGPETEAANKREDRPFLQERLDELREKRKELEKQQEEARHRKMVMLGHIKPE